MSDALYGFIGVLFGSGITFGIAILNNRKDYKLKKLEYDSRRNEEEANERKRINSLRLERYTQFLGAYRQVHGGLIDVIQAIRNRKGKWPDVITEIIDSKEFSDAIVRLNEGAAWIQLISKYEETGNIIRRLNLSHDAIFDELIRAKNDAREGNAVDIGKLETGVSEIEGVLSELSKALRREVAI